MAKIKVIEFVDTWENGGIHTYILNLVKELDKEKYHVHILTFQKKTELFDPELRQIGCKLICLSQEIINNSFFRTLKTMDALADYLKITPCDVIHLHVNNGVALCYARIAKKMGIRRVIAHCHNSRSSGKHRFVKWVGHSIGRFLYRKDIDVKIACSDMAAKWLYCKRDLSQVIQCNCIVNLEHFAYSDTSRRIMRQKYGLGTDRVYLFVGRLHEQKNPLFLIEIFNELLKKDRKIWLVIIGDGPLEQQVHRRAKDLEIYGRILFVRQTRAVNNYMSMADVFILPSRFEGNPIVITEAQSAGLPCYLSGTITKKAKILKTTEYIEATASAKAWAGRIAQVQLSSAEERRKAVEVVRRNGFNLKEQICEIENLYENC